jgi:hypothetical protein
MRDFIGIVHDIGILPDERERQGGVEVVVGI